MLNTGLKGRFWPIFFFKQRRRGTKDSCDSPTRCADVLALTAAKKRSIAAYDECVSTTTEATTPEKFGGSGASHATTSATTTADGVESWHVPHPQHDFARLFLVLLRGGWEKRASPDRGRTGTPLARRQKSCGSRALQSSRTKVG
jgi:hypothetical protein